MHTLGLVIADDYDRALHKFADYAVVDRYKSFLDENEVAEMAKSYGLTPTATEELCEKMQDWCDEEGFVENGRVGFWSTANPHTKFDWYQIGGTWSGLFKLKEPKRSFWWFIGAKPIIAVNQARLAEIDVEDLAKQDFGFILCQDAWHEGTLPLAEILDGKIDKEWQKQQHQLIKGLPQDALLTVIDLHS